MMRGGWALLRVLGLASCLSPGWLHADDVAPGNPPKVLESAGALLGEMKELGQEYLDARYKRGMTPEKLAALAQRSARQLAGKRDGLAALRPQLDPASEFAARLGKFLARWPDEAAFRQDLLAEEAEGGRKSQGEIVSLWLLVPDQRKSLKPLFPLFRP